MADIEITNCHTHTFTNRHVPRDYPHPFLRLFKNRPWLILVLSVIFQGLGQADFAAKLRRLHRFQREGAHGRQSEVLDGMMRQYPGGTRFVVLPMDMSQMDHGPLAADLRAQHDELAALAAEPRRKGLVIPFATLHPEAPGAMAEVRRCVEQLGFRGIKIYPRLGFAPDHRLLMQELYPYAVAHDLPIMTHCSRGGVARRRLDQTIGDRYCEPNAYLGVLHEFPKLRLCLAHFGGNQDWVDYVDNGLDPDPDNRMARRNWQVMIRDMIGSGLYPNLYTDISYTLFQFEDFVPFLRLFLEDKGLAQRVLFGSDHYMTRQEALSERAVCFRLRVALGEDMFRQIAETNPAVWLGEPAEVL